jgi:DNA-binding transcriptional MerR regulator
MAGVLIGQLARLTGTSERLIRYYERVGLLTSSRRANGYRDYEDTAVQTVRQIRALLSAGLSTALIRQVLPCALPVGSLRPCPGVLDKLQAQLAQLDQRADELAQARRTLRGAIESTKHAEQRRQGPHQTSS